MRYTIIFLLLVSTIAINAQDTASTYDRQAAQNNYSSTPGLSKFMLRGYFHSGFESVKMGDKSKQDFVSGSFNPIFMYKQSDALFFEAELEGQFEDGKFELGLEYANIAYVLNDYATLRVGKFLLPFGTFGEKLHPAWVNRLATKPLGFGHDGITPTSDLGVEVRGAFYAGSIKLNYQVYIINGPQLKTGSVEPDEAGLLNFGFVGDNNSNKSIGGRIGVFPFSNSMMEIGVSGLSGKVGTDETVFKDVTASLYAVDFSLVKKITAIKSMVDVKGQFNYSSVSKANYNVPDDTTGLAYTFDNASSAYYAQLSVRPAYVDADFIKNLELVGRYSSLKTPVGSMWESNPIQIAVGLNYWVDWRTVVKVGFQTTSGMKMGEAPAAQQDLIYIHWAMGF